MIKSVAHFKQVWILLLVIQCLVSCSDLQQTENTNHINSKVSVKWAIHSVGGSGKNMGTSVTMKLINRSDIPLADRDWTIYFNQLGGIPDSVSSTEKLHFENISGDYHKCTPTPSFIAIPPGDSASFDLYYSNVLLRKSFAPAGMYIVRSENKPEVIADLVIEGFDSETFIDMGPPSSESRYAENEELFLMDLDQLPLVLPRPVSFSYNFDNAYELHGNVRIAYNDQLENEALFLKTNLEKIYNHQIQLVAGSEGDLVLGIENLEVAGIANESYGLEVNGNGISIVGADEAGVFYGIQSLMQLVDPTKMQSLNESLKFPFLVIKDAPRFGYRGLQLDVSRNFHTKEKVLEILDLMAFYKLNKFHFTITNDEGWRIEIPGLPELTEIGAFRGHTEDEKDHLYPAYGSGPVRDANISYGSGYYTREDFIDILRYAHQRHIEVIPEIDLPGHARAAIKAMQLRHDRFLAEGNGDAATEYLLNDPDDQSVYRSAQNYRDNVICVCKESAYRFTEKVIEEIVKMYQDAEAPLVMIHSGGDEVPYGAWQKSPICANFIKETASIESTDQLHYYFLMRFKEILDNYDITTGGWEEIVLKTDESGHNTIDINTELIGQNLVPFVWNSVWGWGREDMAYKLANLGFEIVMCNSGNLYFDLAYNSDPAETGLSWSGLVDSKTVFSYSPEKMFNVAEKDQFGEPLSLEFVAQKVRLTEEGKKNILGIQAELWSETLQREELLDYMLFPKLLAFAERSWGVQPQWTRVSDKANQKDLFFRDWNEFVNILGQRELARIDHIHDGIKYRIPLPGAIIQDGILYANVRFPGLLIRYTTDGSDPDVNSPIFSQPLEVHSDLIKLKTFNTRGRGSRTAILKR